MAGAGVATAAGGIGIFGILKEIIDEVGDITQALIEQLNAIKLIDKKVETTSYRRYRGHLTKRQVTTDHYVVTLWEVLFLGLVFGVWRLVRGADGKLGLSLIETVSGIGPFIDFLKGGSEALGTGALSPLTEHLVQEQAARAAAASTKWDMPVTEEGGVGRVGRHGNPADEDD